MSEKQRGFTIVELLIVIVVIAILAAISIVAYGGIQERAHATRMQSDLRNTVNKIQVAELLNGRYPTSLSDMQDGVEFAQDVDTYYAVDNAAIPPTFCLSLARGDTAFHATQDGTINTGLCPGQDANGGGDDGGDPTPPVSTVPTRDGYSDFSTNNASPHMSVNLSGVPTGSWMMIVVATHNASQPSAPAGWATVAPRATTGSLAVIAYGKIKQASDPSTLQLAVSSGSNSSANGVLLWGSGASEPNTWTQGPVGWRNQNGTQTTTVAPGVTTTSPHTLVLTISAERTSAMETAVSKNGAAPWVFSPQQGSTRIQTISVGYTTHETPTTTMNVTTTYANPHDLNGIAFQIAIPTASS